MCAKVLRQDRLVVVAETRPVNADPVDVQNWMATPVDMVMRTNNVAIYALMLVAEGSLPRLASGAPDTFQVP